MRPDVKLVCLVVVVYHLPHTASLARARHFGSAVVLVPADC